MLAAERVGDMRHPRATSGFTLVELMVVIAIVAILLAIGLPSFQGSLRSNRVATTTNELLASLNLARTEAIRSTRPGVLCASADGSVCGTDWNAGWMVWPDLDNDSTRDANEAVVRYVQGKANLDVSATGDGVNIGIIRFDSRGRPVNNDVDHELVIASQACPTGQYLRRRMTLSSIGQVNTQQEACP